MADVFLARTAPSRFVLIVCCYDTSSRVLRAPPTEAALLRLTHSPHLAILAAPGRSLRRAWPFPSPHLAVPFAAPLAGGSAAEALLQSPLLLRLYAMNADAVMSVGGDAELLPLRLHPKRTAPGKLPAPRKSSISILSVTFCRGSPGWALSPS